MAKRVLFPTSMVIFSPGGPGSGIVDFQFVPNFDQRKVMAIINSTVQQTMIYAVASYAQGLGGSWISTTQLQLSFDTSSMTSGDLLQIIYDDGEVGIHDANGLPIYSSPDNLSERNGLDVNILNGSVIGQVNQPLDDPYGDSAVSVAYNQGGMLKSPRMDPVTNEFYTKVVTTAETPIYVSNVGGGGTVTSLQGTTPWLSQLVDGSSNALRTDIGTYDAQTLRVVLATGQSYPVTGTINLATNVVNDLFSITYTSTGQTGAIASNTQMSYDFQLWVGTVTGTNPTMDLKIQQSFDNSQWFDVYHFPRVTTSGTVFVTPNIRVVGAWIRYVRTIAGTTPSFAGITLTRISRSGVDANTVRNFFDRNINLNTLNSVSSSYYIGGCDVVEMTVCNGAGGTGTNPHISIEISDDNSNWTTTASVVTNLAPSTCGVVSLSNTQAKFVRAKVTTAGSSGHTLNYVCLKGYGT